MSNFRDEVQCIDHPVFSTIAVVTYLVVNGEKQDEDSVGGQKRVEALRQLLKMNPSEAMSVRNLCVSCLCPLIDTHSMDVCA